MKNSQKDVTFESRLITVLCIVCYINHVIQELHTNKKNLIIEKKIFLDSRIYFSK